MSKLSTRTYIGPGGMTQEQARELAAVSREIGRQIGLLINRDGKASMVLVGDPRAVYIPELPRGRSGPGRLRGLRLLHTHLADEKLSEEDLMDMVFLRLDGVAALTVDADGYPDRFQGAWLLPPNPDNKPYELLDQVRWDRTDIDFPAVARALEDELARMDLGRDTEGENRALLVSVSTEPAHVREASLEELGALAETAGLLPVAEVTQRIRKLNPKFILGKGKLADLEVTALRSAAQVILFDRELSPAQMRNLADITERKILDRTQLILDIFAQRAASRAGKLQVEMAQLKYTLPRLVGKNKAMSRLMGGIGGRGPGETKLEIDRRRVQERITRLKKELDKVRKQRGFTRERRSKAGLPVVSLVGYTNAGKSTLLNTLTQSGVLAENKLFATLDPTSRRIRFPKERELILTDTVGFIKELPEELKEAFQATLEELDVADLLLHVADASHPDVENHVTAVESILREMDLHETDTILVLNKWDRLDAEQRTILKNMFPKGIPATARKRPSLEPLVEAVLDRVPVQAEEW